MGVVLGWGWVRRGAVPAFDRWHVGLSKLHRRLAISLLHGVAGLTAGVANRPLENDRQTRGSPRPARHEKHKRTKADHRLRDSLSKDCCAGCYARLPLVRQRVNYNDEGTQQVLIFGPSPECRNPGAEHRCQCNQPGIRMSGLQIRPSAQRVSGGSRRTPQFETRAPASNTRIHRCEDDAPPSNSGARGSEARTRPKNTRPIGPSRPVLRHQTFEVVALRLTFHRQRVEAGSVRSKVSTSDRGMRLFKARMPRSAVRA